MSGVVSLAQASEELLEAEEQLAEHQARRTRFIDALKANVLQDLALQEYNCPICGALCRYGIPGDKLYPHYVGESDSLRGRLAEHRGSLTGGYYWVYDSAELRKGRLVAVHNRNKDKPTFDRVWDQAKDFALLLRFFILPFPPDPQVNTRRPRLRTELGLAQAIGQHFASASTRVWDQTCGPTHEKNRRGDDEPEVEVRLAVPSDLVGIPSLLEV